MNIDGARNAKLEIFRGAFGYRDALLEGSGTAAKIVGRPTFSTNLWGASSDGHGPAEMRRTRPADLLSNPSIAIGIRRARTGPEDCELALFAEHSTFRHHPIVEKAMQVADGEARFYSTGKNRLFGSHWSPSRHRPLRSGLSLAHVLVRAGTLGGIVHREGQLFLLSNNHVLAQVNKAKIGDAIIQPASGDGGSDDQDVVAFLANYVPIDTSEGAVNYVDCAIAALAAGTVGSPTLMSVAGEQARTIKGVGEEDLFVGDVVWKAGRTSGLSQGQVFASEVDNFVVNVGTSTNPLRARFDNQIQAYAENGNFSMHGDSGSLVVDADGYARGLLFAGTDGGGPQNMALTAINPISSVLQMLDVDLWMG